MSAALQRPAPPLSRVTATGFLSWPGDGLGTRYHLVDGRVAATAPPSRRHGLIHARLGGLLDQHLRERGSPCHASVGPGVQPRSEAKWNVRIPDLAVECDPVEDDSQVVRNPVLLIEILSPSHESVTRGNVWIHRDTPSVREILILYFWKVGGELLRRGAGGAWPAEADPLDAGSRLRLDSIGLSVPLAEAYATSGL